MVVESWIVHLSALPEPKMRQACLLERWQRHPPTLVLDELVALSHAAWAGDTRAAYVVDALCMLRIEDEPAFAPLAQALSEALLSQDESRWPRWVTLLFDAAHAEAGRQLARMARLPDYGDRGCMLRYVAPPYVVTRCSLFINELRRKLLSDRVDFMEVGLSHSLTSAGDVLVVASRRPTTPAHQYAIVKSRWGHLPEVRFAICNNPYTPPALTVAMISALTVPQLRLLGENQTLAAPVVALARALWCERHRLAYGVDHQRQSA